MTFRVVCVDAKGGSPCLRAEQVYTGLAVAPQYIRVDCCAHLDHKNHRWFTWRFRPVTERKTDISIFTKMLTPKRESIDA